MPFDTPFPWTSATSTRAAREGEFMYKTGLQNAILAVIANMDEEFANVATGIRRHLREGLNELLSVIAPSESGHKSLRELRAVMIPKLVQIAGVEFSNQFPAATGTFSFDGCESNYRASINTPKSQEIARFTMGAMALTAMTSIGLKYSGRPVALNDLMQAGAAFRELSTIGSFDFPSAQGSNSPWNGPATVEFSGLKFEATNIKITKKETISEEKIEAIQLAAEAALGALISEEYEVAVVQFEIAIGILKQATSQPSPAKNLRIRKLKRWPIVAHSEFWRA